MTRSICHCRVLCLGDTLSGETLSAGQIVGILIAVIVVIIIVAIIVVVLILRHLRSRLYRFHTNLLFYSIEKAAAYTTACCNPVSRDFSY